MSDVIDDNAWRPPRAASPPPEEIEGYADLVEIGRGGDSVVYKARDLAVERDVAIKVLSVDDPVRAQRFVREIEITVELGRQHPNIVTVLAIGTTASGRPAIVMDYFERGSLHDQLRTRGPLAVDEVVAVGVVVADALAFAHAHGVLHRDVKPQNVLVLPTSWVLADFGIARLIDTEHTASVETFTYRHASPAAARRAAADRLRRHLVAGLDAVHAARRPAAVLQRRSRRRLRAGLPAPGPHREDPRAGPPRGAGRHRPGDGGRGPLPGQGHRRTVRVGRGAARRPGRGPGARLGARCAAGAADAGEHAGGRGGAQLAEHALPVQADAGGRATATVEPARRRPRRPLPLRPSSSPRRSWPSRSRWPCPCWRTARRPRTRSPPAAASWTAASRHRRGTVRPGVPTRSQGRTGPIAAGAGSC